VIRALALALTLSGCAYFQKQFAAEDPAPTRPVAHISAPKSYEYRNKYRERTTTGARRSLGKVTDDCDPEIMPLPEGCGR
jgi:hypothetical protein